MKCSLIRENLSAYTDGQLGAFTRLGLRLHLFLCPACCAEAESLRTLSSQLAALPAPPLTTVRDTVLAAAREAMPPVRAPRRARPLAFAFATAAALALCAVVLLRPAPAQAAYARVIAAAESVDSYHLSHWIQSPDGTRITAETWYDHGRWRTESHRDGQLLDLQVYDGEKYRYYDPQANRVWVSASGDPFATEAGAFTVVDLLQRAQESDRTEVAVERTQDGSGRPVNRFTIATQDHGRIVVLADPETNLPLSIEYYLREHANWTRVGAADTIEYDTPVAPDRLVLTPPEGAEIVDQAVSTASFWERYNQGLDRAAVGGNECVLRDFQVVADGDVFAIWTWTGFFAGGGTWRWDVPENTWNGYTRLYPAGPLKLEDSQMCLARK